ncbi:MAG: hypothetical protein ABI706_19575 [Ilumatobacteraceae bacterium]
MAPWSDFLDVWRATDDIDVFESAWTMDHFYPLTPPLDGPHLESWAVLAALAQATKRLRFGCMVNGVHTNFSGRYFHLIDARCEPKPVQRRIPIVVGGRRSVAGRGRRREVRSGGSRPGDLVDARAVQSRPAGADGERADHDRHVKPSTST